MVRVCIVAILVVTAALASAEKVVLGKLGQTIQKTPIYQLPTSKSRVYYTAKQYEYLVINPGPDDKYVKVLMSNGAQGYVLSDKIARLPYDAVSDKARDGGNLGSRSRASAASYSLKFTGTKYVWGGNDPVNGIDCSGFVKYLYGQIGINLPRTAAQQVHVGKPITRYEDLRAGDRLYFWSSKRNCVGHTGIYLGNGYFNHSSTSRGGVATDHLSGSYWKKNLIAARR